MLTAIRSNLLHNVDCDLRVIILSANGGVFSSGHDLKELVRQLVKVLAVVSNLFMTQCNLPLMILADAPKLFMNIIYMWSMRYCTELSCQAVSLFRIYAPGKCGTL